MRPLILCVALVSTLAPMTLGAADTVAFTEIMRRAHASVVLYEDHELSTVIAREMYRQRLLDADGQQKQERVLVSDYLILQLPPDEDWLALRDVYEVDGSVVGDRAVRLKRLLEGPRDQQADRVVDILQESARFNLASELYYRTVNVPTFPLRFLRPASRERFLFSRIGDERVDGIDTCVVAYREIKSPTFSGTPEGRDLPAQGRFWIDPASGQVVRSEMILGGTRRTPARVTITVAYRVEAALGFRVPFEMRERYDNPRRSKDDVLVGLATYSDFRRVDGPPLVPSQPK